MLTALLLISLTAEPNAAVVLARKTSVSAGDATALTEKVAQRIVLPTLMPYADSQKRIASLGLKDATNCSGAADCHTEIGKLLKVEWLILVSVSQIATDQSIALELFRVGKGDVVERESLLLEKRGDVKADQLEAFARKVAERVGGKSDAPLVKNDPVDPPKDPNLSDPKVNPQPPPLLPPPPPPEKSHATSFAVGGLGLAALGVGVGLLVSGIVQREPLNGTVREDGIRRSDLTGSQAMTLNDATSVQLGIAGATGAVGLGLITTAIALW